MVKKEQWLGTFNLHIKKLEERLISIYTTSIPKGYISGEEEKSIFIIDEIEKLEKLESIYSVFDDVDIKYSKTASEYLDYLNNVRKGLSFIKEQKELIEQKNAAEIGNIQLILKRFKEELEKL